MEFVLPGELSNKLGVSLKTIYNHLSKHKSKIRIKKEFWKTFVHYEDFVKHFESMLQFYNPPNNLPIETGDSPTVWKQLLDASDIQKDYNIALQKAEELERYNLNLQDQVSKYGLLLIEEKNEKKDILNRFEILQNRYNEKIEFYSSEKIKRIKKLYLVVGFAIICLLVTLTIVLYQTFTLRRHW